jgi:cobalt-zinc-cadmium efflux system membrane fusion protein
MNDSGLTRIRILPGLLFIASLCLTGCNRPGEKDDDDEKKPAAKPATAPSTQSADNDEGEKVKLTADAVERYGLRIGKVKKHVLTPTVVVPGRVAFDADATARVAPAVSGRVVELKAKPGEAVQKGDELLVLESTELGEAQSDYLQKQAALEAATAAVEPTRVSHERAKGLFQQNQGVSLAEVQKREAEFKAAQAAEQAARGAVAAAERKLVLFGMAQETLDAMVKSGKVTPRYSVRAPIGGRVVERDVVLGQYVTPDKDSLLTIADTATMWVLAEVPEESLGSVPVGSKARVTLPSLGRDAFEGAVTFIPATVDPATRSTPVRVELKTGDSPVKSGMFARVEIELRGAGEGQQPPAEVIAVPEEAVQTVKGQTCVFVEDDDEENAFLKRPVAVGPAVNGLVPVYSGLQEREEIVKSGGFFLKAELSKSAAKDND